MTVTTGSRLRDLRIGIATDTWEPQINGVTRTLRRLADFARQCGADVRIFTTTDPLAEADCEVFRYPSIPFWAYPQLRIAAPPARLVADLHRWRPDLVHAASPFGIGLAARRAALSAGVPFVTSYHTNLSAYANFYGLGALSAPGWRFLRWFHNSGRLTFCPTHAVASELRGHGIGNTVIWGRGVDTARFNPAWRSRVFRRAHGIEDHQVVVLYVGRMAREKGLDHLIRALGDKQLPAAPVVRGMFVGDGPWLDACRRSAPEGTVFLGQLSGEALSTAFASADIFAFPSVTDTFGNVLLEALASGLPVVAADCAVARELLGDAGAALVPAGDDRGLSNALARLASSAELRAAASRKGIATVAERTWSGVFSNLFEVYCEVVRSGYAGGAGEPAVTRVTATNWVREDGPGVAIS